MPINSLFIDAGHNTPEIHFDQSSGDLLLKGKAIPENATRIFKPVFDWVKEYISEPSDETNLHLDLVYFNTASFIWFVKLIKVLASIPDREKLLVIHLYFDIEEFEEMDQQDLAEAIAPVTDVLNDASVSMGVKVYGKDDNDSVVKEKLILL